MEYFSEGELLMVEQLSTKVDKLVFGKGSIDDVPKRNKAFNILIACQEIINNIKFVNGPKWPR